jgi:PIN domain nuclease of toxin-antitoxin system
LLWVLFDPTCLGKKAAAVLANQDIPILVSVVSFLEISLKYAIGKLELTNVLPEDFPALVLQSGFEILPLTPADAASFHHLARREHKDPFDRLIVWQAILHKLTLLSQDKALTAYRQDGLKVAW